MNMIVHKFLKSFDIILQLENARLKEQEKNEEIKRLAEAAARAEEAVAMAEEAAAKAAEEAAARAAAEAAARAAEEAAARAAEEAAAAAQAKEELNNKNIAEPQYEDEVNTGSSQLVDDETDEVPVTQEIDRVALAERNKRLMEQLKVRMR